MGRRAFALHDFDHDLIFGTVHSPLKTSGVISEHRSRSKPRAPTGVIQTKEKESGREIKLEIVFKLNLRF